MFLFAAKLNSARNVLSHKAGHYLPDREPWLLLSPPCSRAAPSLKFQVREHCLWRLPAYS